MLSLVTALHSIVSLFILEQKIDLATASDMPDRLIDALFDTIGERAKYIAHMKLYRKEREMALVSFCVFTFLCPCDKEI